MIFKNENKNEDMLTILQQLHSYLPNSGSGQCDPQLIAGDQLTIERAANIIHSVANGYTQEDRLEGLILQMGDWHAGLKVLSVSYIFLLLLINVFINSRLPLYSFVHPVKESNVIMHIPQDDSFSGRNKL